MNIQLSIIIPCYNSQDTLDETLQSVYEQDFENWEAIIVNDGSLDNLEEIALKWVDKDPRFKYFKKENGGLGSARNFGIQKAVGDYILPLDSDNKIRPNFTSKAISILETHKNIGVVYGDAMYFGEQNDKWEVGEFDVYKMLKHNYIDACALIRKSLFDEIGLYDTNLPHQGHEDWDFWLRVIKSEYSFYYLKEVAFDYRVSSNSMIKSFNKSKLESNINYIQTKHHKLYIDAFYKLLSQLKHYESHINNNNFIKIIRRKLKF